MRLCSYIIIPSAGCLYSLLQVVHNAVKAVEIDEVDFFVVGLYHGADLGSALLLGYLLDLPVEHPHHGLVLDAETRIVDTAAKMVDMGCGDYLWQKLAAHAAPYTLYVLRVGRVGKAYGGNDDSLATEVHQSAQSLFHPQHAASI